MDLNHLLEREQIERMRAERADCAEARDAHLALAEHYRILMDRQRRRRLATAALTPQLRQSQL